MFPQNRRRVDRQAQMLSTFKILLLSLVLMSLQKSQERGGDGWGMKTTCDDHLGCWGLLKAGMEIISSANINQLLMAVWKGL